MNKNSHTTILPTSAWMWVVNIGLILIVVGTALPLMHINGGAFRYIYSAGALAVLVGRLMMPRYAKTDVSVRLRRLCRMEVWSGVMFCAGAFFMWYVKFSPYTVGHMDWVAFTLAGAVLQIFTSIMIPRVAAKEAR